MEKHSDMLLSCNKGNSPARFALHCMSWCKWPQSAVNATAEFYLLSDPQVDDACITGAVLCLCVQAGRVGCDQHPDSCGVAYGIRHAAGPEQEGSAAGRARGPQQTHALPGVHVADVRVRVVLVAPHPPAQLPMLAL
jgi:hypothetical protein